MIKNCIQPEFNKYFGQREHLNICYRKVLDKNVKNIGFVPFHKNGNKAGKKNFKGGKKTRNQML